MRRSLFFVVTVLFVLLLAGCGQAANTDEPPKIVYGQDICDRCGMIINEEAFAAAYWTKGGEERRFDDIGGMMAYIVEEAEDVASYWVHDYADGEWIRAEEATFVLDQNLKTPMGFGIAAFADPAQAQALAAGQEGVEVLSFAELRAKEMTMPMGGMGGMSGMDDTPAMP
jgi:copper chaperone NosL